jgi:hypothetical protein
VHGLVTDARRFGCSTCLFLLDDAQPTGKLSVLAALFFTPKGADGTAAVEHSPRQFEESF